MKDYMIPFWIIVFWMVVISVVVLGGCATVETRHNCKQFTDISYVEHIDSLVRVYHVRYHGMQGMLYNLVAKLWKIDGIQSIDSLPYMVQIRLSKAYLWNEVEPAIKAVIEDFQHAIESGELDVKELPKDKENKT